MNKQKGFTLIELLVVIAIIGILASVVLAALSSARSKGQDAAVQSQLSSMRAQAELYYSTTGNNSYGTAQANCTATAGTLFAGTNSLATLLSGITTKDCGSTGTPASAWSVAANSVTTSPQGAYCVDSTGVSRNTTAGGVAYTGATTGATPAHTTAGQATCN